MMAKLKQTLPNDLLASLVVFLVALPLCMGIAIASGVPPAAGLITAIIGGIIVGAVSGSPLQVSGPAAGLAVIVFELVQKHGIGSLGPILLIAGAIQMLAGFFKLGRYFRAISPAVVYGMLAGIGILIIGAQLHVMLDDKPKAGGLENFLALPGAFVKGVMPPEGTSHHIAAALGLLTIAIIVAWNRFRPARLKALPGTLIGVVVATAISSAIALPIARVTLPESFLSAVQVPTWGIFAGVLNQDILLAAVAIALVASSETLLSAAAVDRMHAGQPTNFDRELTAQGLGNVLCSLTGGLPMTGVIVRSSANVQAGAKTRLSTMLHGIWLLAMLLAFPGILRLIPTASLAAVLVYTGFRLIELEHLKALRRYGKMPVVIYGATVAGIVCFDLLTGVLIGLGLTLAKSVYKATHATLDLKVDDERESAVVSLGGVVTFLRLPMIVTALESIPDRYHVSLTADSVTYIDHTCHDMLCSMANRRAQRGGRMDLPEEVLEARFVPGTALISRQSG